MDTVIQQGDETHSVPKCQVTLAGSVQAQWGLAQHSGCVLNPTAFSHWCSCPLMQSPHRDPVVPPGSPGTEPPHCCSGREGQNISCEHFSM